MRERWLEKSYSVIAYDDTIYKQDCVAARDVLSRWDAHYGESVFGDGSSKADLEKAKACG